MGRARPPPKRLGMGAGPLPSPDPLPTPIIQGRCSGFWGWDLWTSDQGAFSTGGTDKPMSPWLQHSGSRGGRILPSGTEGPFDAARSLGRVPWPYCVLVQRNAENNAGCPFPHPWQDLEIGAHTFVLTKPSPPSHFWSDASQSLSLTRGEAPQRLLTASLYAKVNVEEEANFLYFW